MNTSISTQNYSKSYIKQIISELQEKHLSIGSSFMKIDQAFEKWLVITESRKNIIQHHRRITINAIIPYLNYKKVLYLRDAGETVQEIDPTTQSVQYRTQYENFVEVKQDFQAHLEVIFKHYTKIIDFRIDEELEKIEIMINHDQKIYLRLPKVVDKDLINERINISTNQTNLDSINNHRPKYDFLKAYYSIANLLYETSKESIHFLNTIKKLISFKKQLKLLVSFVNTNDKLTEIDSEKIKSEMKNFIRACKKSERYIIKYDEIHVNGIDYKREFMIEKTTKVKTTVRVLATDLTDPTNTLIEFSRPFTKLNLDLGKNVDEFYQLYVANK
jgi:hypothetical protein